MRTPRMRMSMVTLAILSAVIASVAGAQTPATPPLLSETAASAHERRETLPTLNVYLPEGQASIRLKKLIKNVLFESQIDYRFVTGDISTFLRYKYYAKNLTYRLGVFDEISFPDIGSKSSNEFQRVRGGLLLFGFPRDSNHRYFYLVQDDRLTFGDLTNVDNKKNNIYMKFGYQFGTQFDERMNAIVGETRGRITPVLTAFRDIGPQKTGLAAALTESLRVSTGDYRYTKFEAESLHRTNITSASFIFSRFHFGGFFGYDTCDDNKRPCPQVPPGAEVPEVERYSIPRYEMLRLGGRNALKAIGERDESIGTHEVHLTNEYFVPIFRNRDFKTWLLHWNTMYGIGYLGAGTVGFKYNELFKSKQIVADAGIGSEMALSVRDYDVLLSVVYARTFHAPDTLDGSKVRFFIRTVR